MSVGQTCDACKGESARAAVYCQWCGRELRGLEDFETPNTPAMRATLTFERRIGRSVRCRFGLHEWSTNYGGIKVCKRDGCRKAKTFGVLGTIREVDFEEGLYETFQKYRSLKAEIESETEGEQ